MGNRVLGMEQHTKLEEKRKLGTFALILSLQSVIDQDHRLVWKKQCLLLFLWELDIPLIILHITYLRKKSGRAAFPDQESQKGNVRFSFYRMEF